MAKEKDKATMDESSGSKAREAYTPPPLRIQVAQIMHEPAALPTHRLEFPSFSGDYPRAWMRRANRFFQVNPMDDINKVLHSSYYLEGLADLWYFEYIDGRNHMRWDLFCNLLLEKFLLPGHEDIVVDFTQLTQRLDVSSYVEQFEEMKALVRAKYPMINEEFYIFCFMKGLKEEIRAPVQLFRPITLTAAMNQAKMMEGTVNVWGRKYRLGQKAPVRNIC